jgi:hypothetical protein
MNDPLATLLPLPILAGFADVFQVVVGVLLSLGGLGILLMGLIAAIDRDLRRGLTAALVGLACFAGGLWLVGVLG